MKIMMFSFLVAIFFSLAVGSAQEPPPPDAVGIDQHLIVMPVKRILLFER